MEETNVCSFGGLRI